MQSNRVPISLTLTYIVLAMGLHGYTWAHCHMHTLKKWHALILQRPLSACILWPFIFRFYSSKPIWLKNIERQPKCGTSILQLKHERLNGRVRTFLYSFLIVLAACSTIIELPFSSKPAESDEDWAADKAHTYKLQTTKNANETNNDEMPVAFFLFTTADCAVHTHVQ